MWPVVPRENGQRLRMGLTCGSRLSKVKKREKERGGGAAVGWLLLGRFGRPGLAQLDYLNPFFL
jgi:hypothetical protein